MRVDRLSKGRGALALRRLRRDREALAFGVLLGLIILALVGAPLYASRVAGTTAEENHLTDALPFAGAYTQVVRASLLQAIDEEWVRTARAKGLSEKHVIRRHVLRNGLIPPINISGLDFSHAFGGFLRYGW